MESKLTTYNKKICITFAGAVGSSKTPISNYLSTKLSLPIFNNDAIRSEVIEDLGFFDSDEHTKRRKKKISKKDWKKATKKRQNG